MRKGGLTRRQMLRVRRARRRCRCLEEPASAQADWPNRGRCKVIVPYPPAAAPTR